MNHTDFINDVIASTERWKETDVWFNTENKGDILLQRIRNEEFGYIEDAANLYKELTGKELPDEETECIENFLTPIVICGIKDSHSRGLAL